MAAFLSRQRLELNRCFQEVRHTHPGLVAEEAKAFLAHDLDQVVQTLARSATPGWEEVPLTLFAMALPLIAQGWLGPQARRPAIATGWRSLLASHAELLRKDTRQVAGSWLNALHQLDTLAPQGLPLWVGEMNRLGPTCPDLSTLLDLGRLLAWRAGLAHLRQVAMGLVASLPPALVTAAVGATTIPDNPWWKLDNLKSIRLVGRVGGFRGFGGPFQRPPHVYQEAGQVWVTDGQGEWLFSADSWGITLLPVGELHAPAPPPAMTGLAKVSPQGVLAWQNKQQTFPEITDATSVWADTHTCVVTVQHSHHVLVFAHG